MLLDGFPLIYSVGVLNTCPGGISPSPRPYAALLTDETPKPFSPLTYLSRNSSGTNPISVGGPRAGSHAMILDKWGTDTE